MRVAGALAVSWSTASDAVLAGGKRVLAGSRRRLGSVKVIGVDGRVRRRTRREDKYVTAVTGLTPIGPPARRYVVERHLRRMLTRERTRPKIR